MSSMKAILQYIENMLIQSVQDQMLTMSTYYNTNLLMLPSSLTGIVFVDIQKNDYELIVLFVCPMFYLLSIVIDISTSQ